MMKHLIECTFQPKEVVKLANKSRPQWSIYFFGEGVTKNLGLADRVFNSFICRFYLFLSKESIE